MRFFYNILLCTLLFSFGSCVKDLDFDQAADIELEPVVAISLLNFDFSINDLSSYNSSMNQDVFVDEVITEEVVFAPLTSTFFQEDLDRIVPEIEGSNEFNNDFTLVLTFSDENDRVTYTTENIIIPANSVGPYAIEEIVILNTPAIVRTTKIAGVLSFQGTVNPSEERRVVINTAGTFYFTTN